ncbi:DUF1573 domain-containing protein [Aureivirga sp. CE67]|uniref:DUF1573 domain-containing protein n=1 Tax=Aureivirga sp. CE67 TaxID=1788983 RepID=UPI0018C9FC2E|nr:DUF1573 domain-containing protein [Aureivirga sp. CE67]
MKKFVPLLVLFLTFVGVQAQQTSTEKTVDPNAPIITFEETVIDYGKIEHKADGKRVFKFKNTGKSPLIISKVKSSCGCTIPKKPEKPVMPGEVGEIEVKYATNRIGGFSKTITVTSNASEPRVKLKIKGVVMKPETTSKVEKKKSMMAN